MSGYFGRRSYLKRSLWRIKKTNVNCIWANIRSSSHLFRWTNVRSGLIDFIYYLFWAQEVGSSKKQNSDHDDSSTELWNLRTFRWFNDFIVRKVDLSVNCLRYHQLLWKTFQFAMSLIHEPTWLFHVQNSLWGWEKSGTLFRLFQCLWYILKLKSSIKNCWKGNLPSSFPWKQCSIYDCSQSLTLKSMDQYHPQSKTCTCKTHTSYFYGFVCWRAFL